MEHITERMTGALVALARRFPRRSPKTFYLAPDDWLDFLATEPPTAQTLFGNNPPKMVTDPIFQEVPCRPSLNVGPRRSRLYDSTGTGRLLSAWYKADRRCLTSPERLAAMEKMRHRPRTLGLQGMELVESLGDGGLWSWASSPHVLWLAWMLKKSRAGGASNPALG